MKRKATAGVPLSVGEDAPTEPQMTALTDTFWHATYRQQAPAVLAFLSSRLGRRELAEDLLQETFVRAIRARSRLRDAGKVRAYLFSTAQRLLLNHFRRKRPVLFSELSATAASEDLESRQEDGVAPDRAADLRRARHRLREVAAAMTPALETAFVAAVLEHKSYAEIARETGWTAGQVRVNVCRARKHAIAELRELLRLQGVSE